MTETNSSGKYTWTDDRYLLRLAFNSVAVMDKPPFEMGVANLINEPL